MWKDSNVFDVVCWLVEVQSLPMGIRLHTETRACARLCTQRRQFAWQNRQMGGAHGRCPALQATLRRGFGPHDPGELGCRRSHNARHLHATWENGKDCWGTGTPGVVRASFSTAGLQLRREHFRGGKCRHHVERRQAACCLHSNWICSQSPTNWTGFVGEKGE